MTARLPIPGQDDGTWGSILNDFLQVSLNSDGTLLTSALEQAGGITNVNGQTTTNGSVTLSASEVNAVPSNSVGTANGVASLNGSTLVPSVQLGSGTASNSNFLRGDGTWAVPSGAPNATTSTPGLLQLDGDLSGTATSPTVTGIQGNEVATGTPNNGQILEYSTTTNKWTPTTPTASTVGALPASDDLSAIASTNATANNVSLNSHKITNLADGTAATDAAAFSQIPTAGGGITNTSGTWSVTSAPPSGNAGGDLTGTYPDPTLSNTSNVESIISSNTTVSGALQKSNNLSDVSSASQALTNIGAMPIAGGAYTGAVIPAAVTLTDAATISINAALGNVFTVTLGGNRTLGVPSNPTAHQMMILEVTQDSSGSRTLSYPTAFEFTGAAPSPILSTNPGTTDYLLFIYSSSASKWRFLDARLGY